MSRTPLFFRSVMTAPQNRAPSPAVGRFRRGLGQPDAQHVLLPVRVDPDRDVGGLVLHHLVVPDLDHDRVQEHHRVDRVQRPGLPGPHLLQHRIGDPRDRLVGQLGAVDLLQVVQDVPHGHAVRVQADDHVVQAAGDPPRALGHQQRLERPGPVPRHRQRHRPDPGLHGLGDGAVAVVPRPAPRPAVVLARSPGARSARPPAPAPAPPAPARRASTPRRSAAAPRPHPWTVPAARPAAGHPSAPAAAPARGPVRARPGRPQEGFPRRDTSSPAIPGIVPLSRTGASSPAFALFTDFTVVLPLSQRVSSPAI